MTYADIRTIHRINGQPTVTLAVLKEHGGNTLPIARNVKSKLEDLKRELPPGLVFEIVDDESVDIRKNLNDLYLLSVLITVIVFAMIYVVLGGSIRPCSSCPRSPSPSSSLSTSSTPSRSRSTC